MRQSQTIRGIIGASAFLFSCLGYAQESRFTPSADLNPIREAPVTRWDEALPLGNGVLGGLLWGQDNTLRISLDRGDLWDLRIPERFSEPDFTWAEMKKLVDANDMATLVKRFDSFYEVFKYPTKLPGGRLEITLDPALKIERFELGLAQAIGQVALPATTRRRQLPVGRHQVLGATQDRVTVRGHEGRGALGAEELGHVLQDHCHGAVELGVGLVHLVELGVHDRRTGIADRLAGIANRRW